MAMRARGGAANQNRGRIGGGVRPVFEEITPVSEWKQDDESHTLVIFLPGFMKEQIKVSTEGQSMIRVRGERLVAGNKWNRFSEDFKVPENCEMNSIRAKFQGGILNVTIPKKVINKPQIDHPLLPKPSTSSAPSPKIETTPQLGQEKITPSLTNPPKDSEPQKTLTNNVSEIRQAPDQLKEVVEKESQNLEPKIPENYDSVKKIEPEREILPASIKNEDKGKLHREMKGKETNELSRNDDYSKASKYGIGKKYAKGIGELNEERQLLVNMGVAVLVIVALSAYVTYGFVSSKNKN